MTAWKSTLSNQHAACGPLGTASLDPTRLGAWRQEEPRGPQAPGAARVGTRPPVAARSGRMLREAASVAPPRRNHGALDRHAWTRRRLGLRFGPVDGRHDPHQTRSSGQSDGQVSVVDMEQRNVSPQATAMCLRLQWPHAQSVVPTKPRLRPSPEGFRFHSRGRPPHGPL